MYIVLASESMEKCPLVVQNQSKRSFFSKIDFLSIMMHQDLQHYWQKMEAEKKNFESTISAAGAELQEFKPSAESWNMLQVLEHMVITEQMSIRYLVTKGLLKSKKAGGKWHLFRGLYLSFMLKSPLKFKVPEVKGIKPKGETKKEVLIQDWASSRRQLQSFLEEFPEDKLNDLIFRHPVAGWLTIGGTLRFFADHISHHRQQLSRIRKSSHISA